LKRRTVPVELRSATEGLILITELAEQGRELNAAARL